MLFRSSGAWCSCFFGRDIHEIPLLQGLGGLRRLFRTQFHGIVSQGRFVDRGGRRGHGGLPPGGNKDGLAELQPGGRKPRIGPQNGRRRDTVLLRQPVYGLTGLDDVFLGTDGHHGDRSRLRALGKAGVGLTEPQTECAKSKKYNRFPQLASHAHLLDTGSRPLHSGPGGNLPGMPPKDQDRPMHSRYDELVTIAGQIP